MPLLEATWPYLGIAELRCVPIRVLECMSEVPPAYLRLLTTMKEVRHKGMQEGWGGGQRGLNVCDWWVPLLTMSFAVSWGLWLKCCRLFLCRYCKALQTGV